jgi:hypothetical protein
MKKANFLFVSVAFAALTFFSSCSAYGPAFSHQRVGYMERPFSDKPAAQVYATGQIGSDATYKPSESNVNGGLGVHLGFSAMYYQGAIGLFGVGGQYKADTKTTYGYRSFGVKIHQNINIPIQENLEIQIVGLGGTFNSEVGTYSDLRLIRSADTISKVKDLGNYWVTTGVRYRTKNNTLLGFQYAYGSNAFIFGPINASHCLSFTGNFGTSTVALNLSIPNSVGTSFKSGLQPTVSVGYTHALVKGGL